MHHRQLERGDLPPAKALLGATPICGSGAISPGSSTLLPAVGLLMAVPARAIGTLLHRFLARLAERRDRASAARSMMGDAQWRC